LGNQPSSIAVSASGQAGNTLSIAVFASGNADCLDIEKGNATTAQAPSWCKRQLARGVGRPYLYTSVGTMDTLVKALSTAGIARAGDRL
jgi:hypothetical protein